MIELELLGTSADGESLVLTDAQGERYSVLISDELRGATRRDRPRVELAPARPTLAPRDIQALLRAGATPAEIASQHGMEVSAVERFEAPVQAEKDYALTRARAVRIGDGGPTMGDLVLDRLAARGVDPSSLEWTATREAGEPWQIIVTFVQGAAEHAAHWHLSNSGSLEAIDQEAQWLTEQVSASPTASIFTPLPRTAPAPVVDPGAEDLRNREAIIDQLNAVRGKRQQIDLDLDDEVDEEAEYLAAIAGEEEAPTMEPDTSTGPISARIYSLASARTKAEAPSEPAEDTLFPATGQIPSARPTLTGAIPVASRSPKTEAPASSGASVSLEDVSFSYEADRPVLQGVSFRVDPGTMTAIVGPSGCGKTTIARLIARFYDVDAGSVRVGGGDVCEWDTADLMAQLSLVFQDVYLFDDTLEANVRVGNPDATRADIEEAARLSGVDEIVERLPLGWDTPVGEAGRALSGGERQRVSIARALLKAAPVVLFDEATSALDPENESRVTDAMAALRRDATLIVIAHKLDTITAADQIVVLSETGRVAQIGTHEQLYAQENGQYRAFWDARTRAAGWTLV